MVRRGEVWVVSLDPAVGCEIRKTRPCVVISPTDLRKHLRSVIVAPMTSSLHASRYRIPAMFSGRRGAVTLDQIRSIDRRRLVRRVGAFDCATLKATMGGLREVFAEEMGEERHESYCPGDSNEKGSRRSPF
ncbi:type II toxin-antitoxin system PemK/MazF family toxin [Pandoraea fibrosis]|uniref:Type II toxin-antitoxin system PemK/MazF family toxin n=1 Tax=Pandoraea fibrosis TaxID=1891094 RepID=A0ABX6HNM6_9BURK|nr:type II toxin-antitoxin system PemK/MazF family toxin [Pandoraea fibrosis]QHF12403.1 type II toxin-antitoxin system PemK/MazF family toxin [Pandoraea fibrosis]